MNNYEYIIASLPDLTLQASGPSDHRQSQGLQGQASGPSDHRQDQGPDVDAIIEEIREQLSPEDIAELQTLLDGFESGKLTPEFYAGALASRQDFIREYFRFDLNVRNTKVAYLNEAIGRPEGTDIMYPCGSGWQAAPGTVTEKPDGCTYEPGDYDGEPEVSAVLNGSDILERERGLDNIMWAKVEELTNLHIFDLDIILGFVVRLKIIDRWLKLDPETGRELFGRLVAEIRSGSRPASTATAATKEAAATKE